MKEYNCKHSKHDRLTHGIFPAKSIVLQAIKLDSL